MPRYEYKCPECGSGKEVVRSFSESDLSEVCDKCNIEMNKVYSTFGIQFKGGGFYSTGG